MSPAPPNNFSWCEPNKLCASAFPDERSQLDYLISVNVGCIVSLTAERHVDKGDIPDDVLQIVPLPIKDYTPPTMEQVEEFIRTVKEFNDKGKAVLIHCAHGLGRTGTMLSCYYVQHNHLSAEKAIAHVRDMRKGSVETAEQEALVAKFEQYLKSKGQHKK